MFKYLKNITFLLFLSLSLYSYGQEAATKNQKLLEAFNEFKKFAEGIPMGSSYITKVELISETHIKITYSTASEIVALNRIIDGVILTFNGKHKYINFYYAPDKKSYFKPLDTHNSISWFGLSSDAGRFYLLLGNLIDASKEATIKNYKQEIPYSERLKIVSSENFVDIIPQETKVILKVADKRNEYYKKLKSYIGKEFKVILGDLKINGDLKTYNGHIYFSENQKGFEVSAVEVEISDTDKDKAERVRIAKEAEEYKRKIAEAEAAKTPEQKEQERKNALERKQREMEADFKSLLSSLDAKIDEGNRIIKANMNLIAMGGSWARSVQDKLDKVTESGDSLIKRFEKEYLGMITQKMANEVKEKWKPASF